MSIMSNADDLEEPFLARWARRKRDAQGQPAEARREEPIADPARSGGGPASADVRETAEAPELDLSKLPKVDELTAESDISAFLDKRVPQLLRNAALSRMWSLDPTIRDFIEVAENQWNWNVPGGAPFYEEMLSVPGELGQAVAEVGGEAGRLLTGQSGDGATDHGQLIDKADIRPKDEDRGEVHAAMAAAPQNAPMSELRAADLEGASSHAVFDESRPNVASQHGSEIAVASRRRHGGALPV